MASDIQTELVQSPRPPDDRNRLEWHEFAERLYQLTVRRLTPGLLHLPKDIELWSQRLAKIERAAVDALVALDDYGVKRTSTSRKAAIKSTVALWKELAAATT